jgi:23S rRNA pseudouridine2605 synthase
MRINRFVAQASGLSRRAADAAIKAEKVLVNGEKPTVGQDIKATDQVTLDGQVIKPSVSHKTIILNKPVGYVCSRNGQGSKTIYDLLPTTLKQLKTVGRLDKDSSGLLLLTTDGSLAQKLTHPSFQKLKVYEIELSKPLKSDDHNAIEVGIRLDDGDSKLRLSGHAKSWTVKMHEGRNRQIRRTFAVLGYKVTSLHRVRLGDYDLGDLKSGSYKDIGNVD